MRAAHDSLERQATGDLAQWTERGNTTIQLAEDGGSIPSLSTLY